MIVVNSEIQIQGCKPNTYCSIVKNEREQGIKDHFYEKK